MNLSTTEENLSTPEILQQLFAATMRHPAGPSPGLYGAAHSIMSPSSPSFPLTGGLTLEEIEASVNLPPHQMNTFTAATDELSGLPVHQQFLLRSSGYSNHGGYGYGTQQHEEEGSIGRMPLNESLLGGGPPNSNGALVGGRAILSESRLTHMGRLAPAGPLKEQMMKGENDGSSPTQVLVKNTFIQLNESAYDSSVRSRTESADAVLEGPRTTKLRSVLDGFIVDENDTFTPPEAERIQCEVPWAATGSSLLEPPDDSEHREQAEVPTENSCGTEEDVMPKNLAASTPVGVRNVGICLTPSTNTGDSLTIESPLTPGVGGDDLGLASIPYEDLPRTGHNRTTIMLRNIPNKYTQKMLLEVVNENFEGLYDFFYLPIDFRNKCNVGYAFINFLDPYFAEVFKNKYHGFKLSAFKSNKVCEVSWGRVQGLKANIEHYRNSAVMSIPIPQFKPCLFQNGQQVPFPTADGPLPSVKLRPQKY